MKLKVFGGLTSNATKPTPNGGLQARTLVCASSKKRAVELLCGVRGFHTTLHEFNNYWAETGNLAELKIAASEGIWVNRNGQSLNGTEPKWERVL